MMTSKRWEKSGAKGTGIKGTIKEFFPNLAAQREAMYQFEPVFKTKPKPFWVGREILFPIFEKMEAERYDKLAKNLHTRLTQREVAICGALLCYFGCFRLGELVRTSGNAVNELGVKYDKAGLYWSSVDPRIYHAGMYGLSSGFIGNLSYMKTATAKRKAQGNEIPSQFCWGWNDDPTRVNPKRVLKILWPELPTESNEEFRAWLYSNDNYKRPIVYDAKNPSQCISRTVMMKIMVKEIADFMTLEEHNRITGHSFRGGRANDCFRDHMDEEMIKRIGRWAHFASVTKYLAGGSSFLVHISATYPRDVDGFRMRMAQNVRERYS